MTDELELAQPLLKSAGALNPDSKEDTLTRALIFIKDIDRFPEFQIMYQNETTSLCVPIFVEEKKPDGDPVSFRKKKAGIVSFWHDSFIISREWGMMSNKTQSAGYEDSKVEKVKANFHGTLMPGLRITNPSEKIKTVLIPHQALHDSDPAAQAALVDEMFARFSSAS